MNIKELSNVGTSKYVVSYSAGTKKHQDGSEFYDIKTFSNKEKKEQFIKELKERNCNGN